MSKESLEKLNQSLLKHFEETGSKKAKEILEDFESWTGKFKKIIPNDYLRMMTEIKNAEKEGLNHEEAVMTAFKKCTAQLRGKKMGFRDECGVCGIYRPAYLEGDATASSMAYFALVAAQWKCPANAEFI